MRHAHIAQNRFAFPKPPLQQSMILDPLETGRARLKEAKAKLTDEAYVESIRSSVGTPTIFLERSVADAFTNSFNPTLAVLWDASTDLQSVLDPYAAAMYIASYMMKDAAGHEQLTRGCRQKVQRRWLWPEAEDWAKVMAAGMADFELDAMDQKAMEDIRKALQDLETNQPPGTTVPDVAELAQGNAAGQGAFDVASELMPSLTTPERQGDIKIFDMVNMLSRGQRIFFNHVIGLMLIIDEISMVGYCMEKLIEARLREVKGSTARYEGIHVMKCGDLYQLQLIGDRTIYAAAADLLLEEVLETHLWRESVQLYEMHEIHRQHNTEFPQVLNEMRVGDKSQIKADLRHCKDHCSMLKAATKPHMYFTNRKVQSHNAPVVAQAADQLITYTAQDILLGQLSTHEREFHERALPDRKYQDCGGLEYKLSLRADLPVELGASTNKPDGMCNGAFGVARSCEPNVVWVKFQNPKVGETTRRTLPGNAPARSDGTWTPILRLSITFQKGKSANVQVMRTRFPLHHATARTIHHAQVNTTLDYVIDFEGAQKVAALVYVGISRAPDASEVTINNLTKELIQPNIAADIELRRLRSNAQLQVMYTPLEQLPSPSFTVMAQNVTWSKRRAVAMEMQPEHRSSDRPEIDATRGSLLAWTPAIKRVQPYYISTPSI
ncbi:hypothetical protein WJX74_002615 [Apatococcus lobatus]|uniref:Uncharacterized protein n=1 Tax=Apatococcus lobatus TaxID=904363 RepID=A0AAW1QTU0_9CHLO